MFDESKPETGSTSKPWAINVESGRAAAPKNPLDPSPDPSIVVDRVLTTRSKRSRSNTTASFVGRTTGVLVAGRSDVLGAPDVEGAVVSASIVVTSVAVSTEADATTSDSDETSSPPLHDANVSAAPVNVRNSPLRTRATYNAGHLQSDQKRRIRGTPGAGRT